MQPSFPGKSLQAHPVWVTKVVRGLARGCHNRSMGCLGPAGGVVAGQSAGFLASATICCWMLPGTCS